MSKAPRLVALVGVDIDDKRYEAGQTITGPIAKGRQEYLIREGYAVETEKLPEDVKADIERGAGSPHSVEGRVDTQEE
jgi:hypothetical protein